jgi:hypothetical protein
LIPCLIINGCNAAKISTSLFLPLVTETRPFQASWIRHRPGYYESTASYLNEMSERASLEWMRASMFMPAESFSRNQSGLNTRIDYALAEAIAPPF